MPEDVRDRSGVEIRPLSIGDVETVTRIHLEAFDRSFLSSLGSTTLRLYYEGIVRLGEFGLVATCSNKTRGFVTGIDTKTHFYRKLFTSRAMRLPRKLAPVVLQRPSIALRILGSLRQQSGRLHREKTIRLTSIAVAPGHWGRGLGRELLERFLSLVGSRGYEHVLLDTDAARNLRVCQFYKQAGFRVARCYEAVKGRPMFEFRKPLEND